MASFDKVESYLPDSKNVSRLTSHRLAECKAYPMALLDRRYIVSVPEVSSVEPIGALRIIWKHHSTILSSDHIILQPRESFFRLPSHPPVDPHHDDYFLWCSNKFLTMKIAQATAVAAFLASAQAFTLEQAG